MEWEINLEDQLHVYQNDEETQQHKERGTCALPRQRKDQSQRMKSRNCTDEPISKSGMETQT